MDLGFGKANQQLGQATANALLQTAQAQEQAVSDEIRRYDRLLQGDGEDDAAALDALRAKRLRELQQQAADQRKFRAAGHGVYTELCPSQQDSRDVGRAFFAAAKESERLVVHFYRDQTEYCQVFHKHLQRLAEQHLETKFVKLNVQDCDQTETGAGFLVERLRVQVMPTLVLIHKRQAVHQIRGFDELGGTDGFTPNRLAQVLAAHGVLELRDSERVSEALLRESSNSSRGGGLNSIRIKGGGRRGIYDDDDEEHEDF